MKLYEFEGKKLFDEAGIPIAQGSVVSDASQIDELPFSHTVVKAQVLSGKRDKAGGVLFAKTREETIKAAKRLLGSTINNETVEKVSIDEFITLKHAYYISISYDTSNRAPILMASCKGGGDVELDDCVSTHPIDMSVGYQPEDARHVLADAEFPSKIIPAVAEVFTSLWNVFSKYDCSLAEINPLIESDKGGLYAADAKIIIDETALWRHKEDELSKFPARKVFNRELTEREIAAKKIDESDHRGVAGSVYFDLDGDIGILGSGGGGLLSGMDVLMHNDLQPANYTEYSGNPPAEKVKALTKVVLSKPGLKGLWLFGGTANFTDLYETLVEGFYTALKEHFKDAPPPASGFPIVIRRGGPRLEEAFEYIKKHAKKDGFNIHLFGPETPITESGKALVDLVK